MAATNINVTYEIADIDVVAADVSNTAPEVVDIDVAITDVGARVTAVLNEIVSSMSVQGEVFDVPVQVGE